MNENWSTEDNPYWSIDSVVGGEDGAALQWTIKPLKFVVELEGIGFNKEFNSFTEALDYIDGREDELVESAEPYEDV